MALKKLLHCLLENRSGRDLERPQSSSVSSKVFLLRLRGALLSLGVSLLRVVYPTVFLQSEDGECF